MLNYIDITAEHLAVFGTPVNANGSINFYDARRSSIAVTYEKAAKLLYVYDKYETRIHASMALQYLRGREKFFKTSRQKKDFKDFVNILCDIANGDKQANIYSVLNHVDMGD